MVLYSRLNYITCVTCKTPSIVFQTFTYSIVLDVALRHVITSSFLRSDFEYIRNDETNCQSEVKCFRCNENGHMSRNCKAAPNMKVVYEDRRLKKLRIADVVVEALVDTGADVSIIKEAMVNKISGVKLQQSVSTLRGLGRGMTRPLGQFNAEVKIDEMQLTHRFLVVPQDAIACDALLGYDFVAKFRVQMTAAGYEFSPPAGRKL
ncbi:uncharacterized protein LOC127566304 [Drosophila albomicans]|uniref:Uncharacterized protein LOC127566304 n=1 Tax=Drosophila albomicans TaxID=7291 RepID=A0A9C6WED1_DROAB|nr:uncharacterized protein LOC127566304 [Drosophila albomicans]